MKYVLSLLLVVGLVAPAMAEETCDPDSPGAGWAHCRFKLSIGWPAVKTGNMVRPDVDAGWRDTLDIREHHRNYVSEYLLANGATFVPFAGHTTLCCGQDQLPVYGPFRGRVGDVYPIWANRALESYEVEGQGIAASLEYRMTGSLWGALSFQSSPQSVAWVRETAEHFRIEYIEPVPWIDSAPQVSFVGASRQRVEFRREHKQKLFQFAGLLKYDLTRRNRYWSVMPQVGAEVLMLRSNEYTIESRSHWRIFAGEYHPSDWAHRPTADGEETTEIRQYRTRIRPVVGATLEFYPLGGRWGDGGLGIVLDGRFYPGGNGDFRSEQGEFESLGGYPIDTKLRNTLTLNVVALF